mmetsp:Transcript_26930/g.30765  ORF Transcript_26930/g.30765 Transcript_26930/m.30765 type:complete len:168 (-) Transcript_26930:458-961(-)
MKVTKKDLFCFFLPQLLLILLLTNTALSFQQSITNQYSIKKMNYYGKFVLRSNSNDKESTNEKSNDQDQEIIMVEPGTESDVLSDELWEEIEGNKPPLFSVMKELLGISVFTYVLGFLIIVMLSLNALLGPGWLGQSIGIPGTGTFTELSDSIPDKFDLSADEYLLR